MCLCVYVCHRGFAHGVIVYVFYHALHVHILSSVRVPGRVAKGDRDPFKLTRFEHRPKLGWGTTTQAKRRTFGMAMSAS